MDRLNFKPHTGVGEKFQSDTGLTRGQTVCVNAPCCELRVRAHRGVYFYKTVVSDDVVLVTAPLLYLDISSFIFMDRFYPWSDLITTPITFNPPARGSGPLGRDRSMTAV